MTGHWTDCLDTVSGEDRLLSWKAVHKDTGLSRTTAWRLQKAGQFPLSVVLSPGRVGYRQREIEAWKRSRVPRRDSEVNAPERASRREASAPSAPEAGRRRAPSPNPVAHGTPASSQPIASRTRLGRVSPDQLALKF